MKHRISSKPYWLGLCSVALAMSCSGSQTPATTNNTNTPPPEQHTNEQPADLSEAPLPDRAVLVVRVASPSQMAERAATLTNIPQLRAQIGALYAAAFGQAADSIVDRNAPLDVMMVADADGDPKLVMSIATTGMDEVQTALANQHRFAPAGNGVLRILPSNANARAQGEFGDDSSGGGSGDDLNNCVLAPTPNAGSSRVVCGEDETARTMAVPFLTRTLTRRDTPAYTVTLDAPMDNLRSIYFGQWRQALDHSREQFDQEANTNVTDTAVRAAVVTLVHQLFDSARAAMEDAAAFDMSLTLNEDGAALHTQFDVRGPNGPLMRAAADAMRNQPAVPPELINHLLPDAWLYAAASMDARPLGSLITEIEQVVTSAVNAQANLAPADRTAITTALAALHILDQATAAEEIGHDAQGHLWFASIQRSASTQGTQYATALHNIVVAMRRPAVAAIVRRLFDKMKLAPGDIGALPDLAVRGLPAGSYGFSFPLALTQMRSSTADMPAPEQTPSTPAGGHGHGHGHAAAAPHHAAHAPAAGPMMQLLMVPNGQDTIVVMGTDARAIYTRFAANTTPGINPAAIAVPAGGIAVAPVMAGFPNMMRAQPNPNMDDIHSFEQMIAQLPDHGTTPATFRGGVTTSGDVTRFTQDLEMPRQAIQNIAALVMGSFSRAAAPPPPTAVSPSQSP